MLKSGFFYHNLEHQGNKFSLRINLRKPWVISILLSYLGKKPWLIWKKTSIVSSSRIQILVLFFEKHFDIKSSLIRNLNVKCKSASSKSNFLRQCKSLPSHCSAPTILQQGDKQGGPGPIRQGPHASLLLLFSESESFYNQPMLKRFSNNWVLKSWNEVKLCFMCSLKASTGALLQLWNIKKCIALQCRWDIWWLFMEVVMFKKGFFFHQNPEH